MSHDLVVIDVSHWQESGSVTVDELIAAGIVGVILKATESDNYTDPTFRKRYDAAIAAGLAVSSYHFMRAGSGEDQMKYYLGVVEPRQGERVVIDWEDPDVGLEDVHDAVEYLLNARPDLQITIYGSSSFLRDRVVAGDWLIDATSLWVASYTTASSPSSWGDSWPFWSLWQYTDKATVAGYGPLDGNRFNGDAETCRQWIGPATEVPPGPPPAPALPTVTLTIDADEPVNVIIVTGQNVATLTA